MIECLRTFLGYCLNCRRPGIVGEFQIFGWQHKFNLCEPCVSDLAKRIQRDGQKSIEGAQP